jgi:hypothetical protein
MYFKFRTLNKIQQGKKRRTRRDTQFETALVRSTEFYMESKSWDNKN